MSKQVRDAIVLVSHDPALERDLWAVPARAAAHWSALQAVLRAEGPVACQTADAEAWWPDHKDVDDLPARTAVSACRQCPAAAPCLAYALAADHQYGIWGGTTPEERRALRWADADGTGPSGAPVRRSAAAASWTP